MTEMLTRQQPAAMPWTRRAVGSRTATAGSSSSSRTGAGCPGWRDVTAEQWRSAQWQRAHCVKNVASCAP